MQTLGNCKVKGLKTIHTFFYFFLRLLSKFFYTEQVFNLKMEKQTYQTIQ